MGRAEKRQAQKRSKKGGRSAQGLGGQRGSRDVLPRDVVLRKLREIPAFGILAAGTESTAAGYLVADGYASFWLDKKEAELACSRLGDSSLRVEGIPLDEIYFDPATRLKPSDLSLRQAKTVVAGVDATSVSVPLFAIDGLVTADKATGVESRPVFLDKSELLEFAATCMDDGAQRVILTDLKVVVTNMLNGPAGPLRDVKLFPAAPALVAMDEQEASKKQALFPTSSGIETQQKVPDVLAGLSNLFPGRPSGKSDPSSSPNVFPF